MTEHQEDACCTTPTAEETKQRLAQELMFQSAALLDSNQLQAAETLLYASYVLLDQSGGRINAIGAWLLQMQANIYQHNGQLIKAIDFSRKAKETAKAVFGPNDSFTCAFKLLYSIRLAQAGYTRGLAMVDIGIRRLEKASENPEAPSAWLEQVLSEGRKVLAEEQKPQSPQTACELFAKLYSTPHNGISSVQFSVTGKGKKRKSGTINVKVCSPSAINVIAEEHRRQFKGVKVKISIEPAAGSEVLHKACQA